MSLYRNDDKDQDGRLTRLEYGKTKSTGKLVDRPNNATVGTFFFDASIGKPVWWNGSKWVDATGTQS